VSELVLSWYTNHCLRSTFITLGFQEGIKDVDLQARNGHRSVQGLNAYKHAGRGHVRAVQQKMAAAFAGEAKQHSSSALSCKSAQAPLATVSGPKECPAVDSVQMLASITSAMPSTPVSGGPAVPARPSGCNPNICMLYTMLMDGRK